MPTNPGPDRPPPRRRAWPSLLLASTLPLLVGFASALLAQPDWAFDAGVFGAFWAVLAVAASLALDSAATRLRGTGHEGVFGPGPLTTAQTFWATMAINLAAGCLFLHLDAAQPRTNHAIGSEALLALLMAAPAALACLAFATIRWWPARLLLTTASACTAAFACMALTWWR